MEPSDDIELTRLLRQWEAPGAPGSLRDRVLKPQRSWRWLLTGTIRVPVPVALAAMLLFAGWLYVNRPSEQGGNESAAQSLAGFEPVARLEPRIIEVSR
jgi:hypothetical protein